jgi:hypothetical protein
MGSETWDTYKKGGMISFDLGINYDWCKRCLEEDKK